MGNHFDNIRHNIINLNKKNELVIWKRESLV